MATDKNKHLEKVLESNRMAKVTDLMEKYSKKRNQVKEALDKKYATKQASGAINSGSYAKHTAINLKFDIDLCLPFKNGSFATLEEMADDLYNFFMNEYGKEGYEDAEFIRYKTRKQRVSVGLTFLIDGEEIEMDITPGRELPNENYSETHDLHLWVREKGDKPATYTKTNIQKHIDCIKGRGDERKIIRLLKVWKFNKGKKRVKSFFIELITIRTFDEYSNSIPSDLWGKLKMTMEFIRDKVQTICLKDPANSNNIVSDTLTEQEKKDLSEDMKRILENIELNEDTIKIYFAENDKFPSSTEENKNAKVSGPAILTTQRFG